MFFPSQSLVPFGVFSSILGAIFCCSSFFLLTPFLGGVELFASSKVEYQDASGLTVVENRGVALDARSAAGLIALDSLVSNIHVSINESHV